jgi:hypothetical protein
MTDKKLHISEADFNRYIENKMTGNERNAFEKELQKYTFEAEALEGILTVSPEKFENDLDELRLKIAPVKQNNRFRIMAAAATVLLLISAGVIWMQIKTQNQPVQTAETKTVETAKKNVEKFELLKKQPAPTKTEKDVQMDKPAQPAPKRKDISGKQILPPPPKKKTVNNLQQNNTRKMFMVIDDNVENKIAAESQQQKEDKLPEAKSVKSRKISAEKQTPPDVTGAAVTAPAPVAAVAPHKVIVEDMEAHPFKGFKKYELYLDSTAILPEGYKKRKVKVKLKFVTDSAGNISDFKNINHADSVLFEKACELVKNGPRWVPETKNGKRVDSEVELRIIFRKR